MATLEKIRQRKKVLALVIGAALLAFIIEEGVRALGLLGSSTTVAKVGNEKIEIHSFQKRMEMEANADQNNAQQTDPEVRRQQVLDEMIHEELLNQEYEKVGIEVHSDEITQLMTGKNAAPAAVRLQSHAECLKRVRQTAVCCALTYSSVTYGIRRTYSDHPMRGRRIRNLLPR